MVVRDREEITDAEEKSTILGALGEKHAREKYGLKLPDDGRTYWKDAEFKNGTPVSIKSAQPDRRFRLFEKDHHAITSQLGHYVFVCYEPVRVGDSFSDSKIDVIAMKRKRAVDVTPLIDGWDKSGHEKGRQQKLQVEAVFDEDVAESSD